MIIVLVILGVFFLLLCFLILTKIVLKIDTYENQYYIQVWGFIKCSLQFQNRLMIELKMPFYKFTIDPFTTKKKKKNELKKKKKVKKKVSFGTAKKILNVLKSFDIKRIRVDLDTSDMLWNGYLYPVFYFLNRENIDLNINYTGEVGVLLHVENRLAKMMWYYLT